MVLNRSPEFKFVIVQIVCVVEIQSESARALTNITCHAKFHASEASGSEEEDSNISLCISLVPTQDTLGRIHFGPWGHYLSKLGLAPQGNATYQISRGSPKKHFCEIIGPGDHVVYRFFYF